MHNLNLKDKKDYARLIVALIFICAGISHFVITEKFVLIVPPFIASPEAAVYISGVFEIIGGVGLLIPRLQRCAAYGLVILLIVVFPANIYMATNNIQLGGILNNQIVQWIRLPLQVVLIWCVLWCTKKK